MQNQPTANAQANARALRRGMTDSERRLWSRLRMEQLGVKFRRQHPLGNYIADFACLSPKLIIELDGSQHADQQDYDAAREEFFRDQGFTVLRFASNEPFVNLQGVLTLIAAALVAGGLPPSQPSPEGGRSDTPPPSQPSPEGGRTRTPRSSP
ncbi:MAG TPA: endonuclease domain-containing protein [Ramlibacter sp.]|nr:endonuclease domain-containing protein [Ramlibacter sp.]